MSTNTSLAPSCVESATAARALLIFARMGLLVFSSNEPASEVGRVQTLPAAGSVTTVMALPRDSAFAPPKAVSWVSVMAGTSTWFSRVPESLSMNTVPASCSTSKPPVVAVKPPSRTFEGTLRWPTMLMFRFVTHTLPSFRSTSAVLKPG